MNKNKRDSNKLWLSLIALAFMTLFIFTKPAFANFELESGNNYSYGSLWYTLSDNFRLNDQCTNPDVYRQINWLMAHRSFIIGVANNAKPYLYYVYSQVVSHNLPAEIALMPMIESAYNPFAYSKQGAAGLWQLMPGTGSSFGIKQNWWYDGRRDISASTKVALNLLVDLGENFHGHWLLAIASYDSGEGLVDRAVNYNRRHHRPTNFWSLSLPTETANYVPRLLALACIIKSPEYYNLHLPYIADAPNLEKVNVGSQIDLALAAHLAHISLKELVFLNPSYNHWATNPTGAHFLIVPRNKARTFMANLRRLPKHDRVTWHRYHVRHGDTLGAIAKRYHTAVKIIKGINHLHHDMLHLHQILLIPLNTRRMKKLLFAAEAPYFNKYHRLPGPQKIIHHVRRHEDLNLIAKEYGVSAAKIRYWNHLHSSLLTTHQKLIIWSPITYREHKYYKRIKKINYHVKKGDSLWKIAHRYHVSIHELLHWNKLKKDSPLHLKQHLIIYKKT